MKKFTLVPHERYLHYKSLFDKQTSGAPVLQDTSVEKAIVHDTTTPLETQQTTSEKLNVEHIISQLPKRNKSKAQSLLSVIDNTPRLDWNNKGEIILDNNCIPTSHITDLLHDALNNTRHEPPGAEEFYSALDTVPLSLISNPKRRSLIGGKRAAATSTVPLPPPGIPNKPAVPLNNWQGLWRRY